MPVMSELDLGRLRTLEARSRILDPDLADRRAIAAAVDDHVQTWMEALHDLPGYGPDDQAAVDVLARTPIDEAPRPLAEVLAAIADGVDRVGVNESSGSFFGFIPGSGLFSGAIADYLASAVNRYSGVYYAGPGAVRMGRACLEWVADLFGYPSDCGGDITSGGSVANLSAVVTARDAMGIGPQEVTESVVYLTQGTHHSVDKALRVAGLAHLIRRFVPLDGRHRMRPEALADLIEADRREGLRPFLVVASAGATDTGAVDPLDAVADVCAASSCWLHVDAAYGGAFALTHDGKRRLRGIGRSDSVVVDPHKGFFLPFGTGVVLVRDRAAMARAFTGSAGYLEDAMTVEPESVMSPSGLSPELTRPFRALSWWFSLQLAGVDAFRSALDEKLLLARHAHRRIGSLDGFEVGPIPDLTVFTFRHVGHHDADAFNRALTERIQRTQRTYLSATVLDGHYTPRFAVLNLRSHLDHVEEAVAVIAATADRLMRQWEF